jgi:apyrase
MILLIAAACAMRGSSDELQYGIQFDAGSSGTRVYVYQWSKRESAVDDALPSEFSHGTSKPKLVQVNGGSMKVQPGISAFGTDPSLSPKDAGASLSALFDFACATLKAEGCDADCQAETPAFLGATAGMRVLPVEDAEDIMASVDAAFASSVFRFDDGAGWARIISGEEEGGFGWLAVNWLAGTLSVDTPPDLSASRSVGALDLGGASTQISFLPSGESVLASYFLVSVNTLAAGIYTHSYLYFGRDLALEQQAALLAAAATVTNPCFPVGSNDTSAEGLAGSSNATACAASARAILVDAYHGGGSGSGSGDSSSSFCFHADGKRCGFLGEYQPSPASAGSLYAFSNFAYTWAFLGASATADLADVRARAEAICAMDLFELAEYNAQLPDPAPSAYLSGYCFSAMYALELLTAGYGFPEEDSPITVVDDVNGTEVTWALGSIVYHANALGWELLPPAAAAADDDDDDDGSGKATNGSSSCDGHAGAGTNNETVAAAAGVLGGVAGALLVGLCWCACERRRRARSKSRGAFDDHGLSYYSLVGPKAVVTITDPAPYRRLSPGVYAGTDTGGGAGGAGGGPPGALGKALGGVVVVSSGDGDRRSDT